MPSVSLTVSRRGDESRVVTREDAKRGPAMRGSGGPARDAGPGQAGDGGAAADPRHVFGRFGEDAAAEHLRRRGFEILARNVRSSLGEIDLVALDGDVVVFVEVKARRRGPDDARRTRAALVSGLEAVDARKQRRLVRLAQAFLARAGWSGRAARFDVVAVAGDGACTHVANAFDCAT